MPAMIFLCEQCGDQEAFIVDLSVQQVYDKSGSAPICNTPQCGKELSPIISMTIKGIKQEEKSNYEKMLDDIEREKQEHQQFLKREKYVDCSGISEDDIKQLRIVYEKEKRFK